MSALLSPGDFMRHKHSSAATNASRSAAIKKIAKQGSRLMRQTLLYLVKLRQYETRGLEGVARVASGDRSLGPPLKSPPRWYLIQCKARQDERALEHLERQGFECYRPLYEKEHIRRGRRELASVALFPSYLFIRLDRVHDNWLPIRSTRGGASDCPIQRISTARRRRYYRGDPSTN